MIVYDVAMKALDTKEFPQHNIAGLISGITVIVLFQSGEASTLEENKHTHTHTHTLLVICCFHPLIICYFCKKFAKDSTGVEKSELWLRGFSLLAFALYSLTSGWLQSFRLL